MITRGVYRPGLVLRSTDLYVGRGRGRTHMLSGLPAGQWGWLGNPFDEHTYGLETCIRKFAVELETLLWINTRFRVAFDSLCVERVLCWCALENPCHGDAIIAALDAR